MPKKTDFPHWCYELSNIFDLIVKNGFQSGQICYGQLQSFFLYDIVIIQVLETNNFFFYQMKFRIYSLHKLWYILNKWTHVEFLMPCIRINITNQNESQWISLWSVCVESMRVLIVCASLLFIIDIKHYLFNSSIY